MKRPKTKTFFTAAILVIATDASLYLRELFAVGAAYEAKVLCSGVFVSKRSPKDVLSSDLAADDLALLLRPFDAAVDTSSQMASSNFFGLLRATALYRPGLGCALAFPGYTHQQLQVADSESHAAQAVSSGWPDQHSTGERIRPIDQGALESALDWAFSEPEPEHLRRTRAVVIVHNGQIAGERYAPGFDKNTPLLGWSMTKSVMHALAGVLVREGKLSLSQETPPN